MLIAIVTQKNVQKFLILLVFSEVLKACKAYSFMVVFSQVCTDGVILLSYSRKAFMSGGIARSSAYCSGTAL